MAECTFNKEKIQYEGCKNDEQIEIAKDYTINQDLISKLSDGEGKNILLDKYGFGDSEEFKKAYDLLQNYGYILGQEKIHETLNKTFVYNNKKYSIVFEDKYNSEGMFFQNNQKETGKNTKIIEIKDDNETGFRLQINKLRPYSNKCAIKLKLYLNKNEINTNSLTELIGDLSKTYFRKGNIIIEEDININNTAELERILMKINEIIHQYQIELEKQNSKKLREQISNQDHSRADNFIQKY